MFDASSCDCSKEKIQALPRWVRQVFCQIEKANLVGNPLFLLDLQFSAQELGLSEKLVNEAIDILINNDLIYRSSYTLDSYFTSEMAASNQPDLVVHFKA